MTKGQFAEAIEKGTVADMLLKVPVEVGQCVFLPAGTAHAIGPGLLIAQVQPLVFLLLQPSNRVVHS